MYADRLGNRLQRPRPSASHPYTHGTCRRCRHHRHTILIVVALDAIYTSERIMLENFGHVHKNMQFI
jgi:hypothetical protein